MSDASPSGRRSGISAPILAIGGMVGLAVLAFLAFGVFGIHTAFTDDEVDEALPTFGAGDGSGIAGDETSEALADDMNQVMVDEGKAAKVEVDESMEDGGMVEAEIVTERTGSFVARSHPASGVAKVLAGSDQRFLRFEDFATDNGPDLNVYLVPAAADAPKDQLVTGDDYVDLGDLKGNIGAQNYEIPADVDTERFSTVVIWCVRFGVAFGAAEMSV